MNVEKLSALVDDLLKDYKETNIANLLQMLMTNLQNQASAPSEPSFQKSVTKTLASIRKNLENAPSNNFPKDWENMMDDFKIRKSYGKHLLTEIDNILSENRTTPALIIERIRNIYETINSLQSHLTNMENTFEYFDIDKDYLEKGKCEISIILPPSYARLDKLSKELGQLNKNVLRPFIEVVGEKPDGFAVRGIASSNLTFYLCAIPAVAFSIMTAIKLALSIYTETLNIKLLKIQLEKTKIGEDVTGEDVIKDIDNVLKRIIKNGSEKGAYKLLEELKNAKIKSSESSGRYENETHNQIACSIEKLIKRLDEGFSINVRGEMHKSREDESQELSDTQKLENELIKKIQDSKEQLMYRNTESPQMPELLSHVNDDSPEEDNSE